MELPWEIPMSCMVKVLHEAHVPLKQFRLLLGKLQHAARILPAAKGISSPLNKARMGDPNEVGLGKHSEVQSAILNLKHIMVLLAMRPAHLSEVVEHEAEMA
jgi:hypothetical protein